MHAGLRRSARSYGSVCHPCSLLHSRRSETETQLIRLTSILVSRFLLDLRSIYLASDSESNTTDPVEQTIDPQTSSSLVFAAGNLGAPLEDIMSDPEERYVRVTEDEVAYVSEDPLAMGLHSSQGSQEELGQSNEGSRSLKEYVPAFIQLSFIKSRLHTLDCMMNLYDIYQTRVISLLSVHGYRARVMLQDRG